MKKIGILCAGDTELAAFLPYVKETEVIEKAMLVFHCGNIDRVEVVLLYSGVCKVNAAIAAQLLIDCFAGTVSLTQVLQGAYRNKCSFLIP